MKYFLLAITLIIFVSCESPQKEPTNALTEEIISVVYMSANNKSKSQIDDFSDYYQKQMKALEPDVLSWRFFKSGGEKITLIERYKNEGAILNHIKNVSPQGVMEEDFVKFMDHFVVDSLTYYGDMDISILNEKPKNRMPIKTAVMSDGRIKSILDRLEKALSNNHRVYWVCPLIEDSEVLALTSAEYRFDILKERFPTKNIGLVHGQMSVDEKDEVMRMFADGEINLLVSTTVIEVGVDVPSASIMIIEGAERFGLAQLHQLRGRVGRGSDQSSCILIYSGNLGKNSKARLEILRDTEDGFKISEEDLRIRGAGDVLGIQQSGLPQFLIANLETQNNLLEIARDDARLLLDTDPNLTSERGMAVRELLYLMDLQRSLQYIKVG